MNCDKFLVIALDGGAASGKSTTARLLAEKLHLLHVDTGMHYRAISDILLLKNIGPGDLESIKKILSEMRLGTRIEGNAALMTINESVIDLSRLRAPRINASVSSFAGIPEIRQFLLKYQRWQKQVAKDNHFNGIAIEGRDATSVIFPDADFRFFIEADEETRTKRRALQGEEDSISRRDFIDASRKAAPMICAPGVIRIDTSSLSRQEVAESILNMIKLKILNKEDRA